VILLLFINNICKVGISVCVKMSGLFFLSVVGGEKNKISESGSLLACFIFLCGEKGKVIHRRTIWE